MSSLTDKAKSILTRLMEKASSTEASPQVEVEEPQTELLTTVADNNTSDIDGIHHINIWNNGKTELGRMLYQTANAPFSHPEFGHFASVLGFWQWLIEKNPDDELRRKYNGQIKKYLSRRGDRPTRFIANKEDIFFAINWMKIEQNQKIKEALLAGRRVATNLNIFVEHMLPPDVRKIDLTRLPDLPALSDLNAIGLGSDTFADEDKFGLIVLDEASGMFNAREWADKSRQGMIDWLKHARKLRWHVYIIAQTDGMIDKQIRDAFGEHLVVCKRMDRLSIPFIGMIGKLAGIKIRPPKLHVGIVRYGMASRDPVVDRWLYRGTTLYRAYDTEQ